ncbi:MAG: serine hydrolase domain-containing protein [Caulobacteraceae bacterium]
MIQRRLMGFKGGHPALAVGAILSLAALHNVARAGAPAEMAKAFEPDQRLVPAIAFTPGHAPDLTLSGEMARLHVPAVSIAVVRDGKILWARGYGRTRLQGPPTSTDTRFQGASLSKTITAVAVLRLVEQGKLDLDEDVNVYLKQWKLPEGPGQHVTLRQLLSHTAGLNVGGFTGYRVGDPFPTTVQVLDGAPPAVNPPVRIVTPPGSAWSYSGGGYTIVQQLLVDVTGEPFAQLMQELVLEPVGMTHSDFTQPLPPERWSSIALGYKADGAPLDGGPRTYPELAAAGVWTTPSDLALFLMELQRSAAGRGKLLTQATTRMMFTPGLGHWGLGFEVEGEGASRRFDHVGSNEGYKTIFVGYLSQSDGAVVMADSDNADGLREEVLRTIAAHYGWKGYEVSVKQGRSPTNKQLARLAGAYVTSDGRRFEVDYRQRRLLFRFGAAPAEALHPTSANTFFEGTGDVKLEWRGAKGGAGAITSFWTTSQFTRVRP